LVCLGIIAFSVFPIAISLLKSKLGAEKK
jgi:hypothetical protein